MIWNLDVYIRLTYNCAVVHVYIIDTWYLNSKRFSNTSSILFLCPVCIVTGIKGWNYSESFTNLSTYQSTTKCMIALCQNFTLCQCTNNDKCSNCLVFTSSQCAGPHATTTWQLFKNIPSLLKFLEKCGYSTKPNRFSFIFIFCFYLSSDNNLFNIFM